MKDSFGNVYMDATEFTNEVKKAFEKKLPEGTYVQLGIANRILVTARDESGKVLEFYHLLIEEKDGTAKVKLKKHKTR